jgi:hypothetical protein
VTEIEPEPVAQGLRIVDESERFKIAQAMYSVVTGKTEKLSKSYSNTYVVKRADLNQLDIKFYQICGQWAVLEKSSNVTIHHTDDAKEQFSSFERFKLYDASNASPTESVVYEFNVLLRVPNVERPQPYKTTVRALSRVAFVEKLAREGGPPASFMRFFTSGAIVAEIEYVDYTIARNIQSMLDSWVAQIERIPEIAWAKVLQRYSHYIPPFVQVLIILVTVAALATVVPAQLGHAPNPEALTRALLWSAAILWIATIISRLIARYIERVVDEVDCIGAVVLNVGDERLLEKYRKRGRGLLLKAAISVTMTVAQAVFTKAIVAKFMAWLSIK